MSRIQFRFPRLTSNIAESILYICRKETLPSYPAQDAEAFLSKGSWIVGRCYLDDGQMVGVSVDLLEPSKLVLAGPVITFLLWAEVRTRTLQI